ncbi:CoA-binding protein [Massilia sp. KIM]|uniref:CoA-binding protein n=1 Tax=Massilia sp. KIM TaxID=1955422 RepID=UPI00098EDC26|nr:CoA-binding protein [Massilia sp. KIM]OON59436.1 CoA-binding protein [Massilia sp. KIM]
MRSIAQILHESKIIAIVGMSNKPDRASNEVGAYLKQAGYQIIPINPSYAGQTIHDETVYASLQEAADALASSGQRIDIVDCFRKSEDIPPVAREAIAVRAGCLWMQLDIENQAAADLARAAGLDVVMNRCIKIEHRSLQD